MSLVLASLLLMGPISEGGLALATPPKGAEVVVLRYRLDATNTGAAALDDAALTVAVPVPTTAGQRLTRVSATGPGGDAVWAPGVDKAAVIVPLGHLEPGAQAVITITAEVAVGLLGREGKGAWDGPIAGIDYGVTTSVSALVGDLGPGKGEARVRAIYDLLSQRVKPDGFRAARRAVDTTLTLGRGDCTDLALVTVAVARVAGLPARLVNGWLVDRSMIVDADAYHDWAEVFDGARWHVLDVHAQVFDPKAPHRVVLRYEGRRERARPGNPKAERGPGAQPPAADPLEGLVRFSASSPALTVRMLPAISSPIAPSRRQP